MKKPMSDFLKEDVLKQLNILREKKEALHEESLVILQETVDILNEQKRVADLTRKTEEELKRLSDRKKNDNEVLEILGELTSEQEISEVQKDVKTQYKNSRFAAR